MTFAELELSRVELFCRRALKLFVRMGCLCLGGLSGVLVLGELFGLQITERLQSFEFGIQLLDLLLGLSKVGLRLLVAKQLASLLVNLLQQLPTLTFLFRQT